MAAVAADTHAIVWYLLVSPALSAPAMQALDGAIVAGDPVFVASISLVELVTRDPAIRAAPVVTIW